MDLLNTIAVIAAGSSLVAGITTLILSQLHRDLGKRHEVLARTSRKAELKAITKALRESTAMLSERGLRRIRLLLALAATYALFSVTLITFSREQYDGFLAISMRIAMFALAGGLAAGILGAVLAAYMSLKKQLRDLEEEIGKIDRNPKSQSHMPSVRS